MTIPESPSTTVTRRFLRLTLAFILLLLGAVLAGEVAAWQTGPPRRGEEEEEKGGKPPAGKRAEEEEGPPGKNKVIRVDDPDTQPKKPAAEGAPADIDLKTAARRAKHSAIRTLFRSLAVPHDELVIVNGITDDSVYVVRPIPQYISDDAAKRKGDVKAQRLNNEFRPVGKPRNFAPTSIRRLRPYELIAQEKVDEFLGKRYENFSKTDRSYLSVLDKLTAAEQALGAVARWHESARAGEERRGEEWEQVLTGLRGKLLDVRLERLRWSIEKGNWDEAFALARQTASRFSGPEEQKKVAELAATLVSKALEIGGGEDRHKEVQRRLREFEEQFPGSKATAPIRKALSTQAQALFDRAAVAKKNKRLDEARQLLRQAEEIYPYLPGLRELKLEIEEEHPTLRVGVRELPIYLSPARASTDAECQAVEFLFEGLVKLAPEPGDGRYRLALAQGRPQLIPLGREFTLPRNGFWSNGKPITSADVKSTVQLLKREWSGRTPDWADDLFDGAFATDPYRVKLTLLQGYLDPLALMAFKILPEQMVQKPDDKDFARQPVGSGPFRFAGNASDSRGRPYVKFLANPHYRDRPGHAGLPRIHEIQFFETRDPIADFPNNLDLVLDLRPGEVARMRAVKNVTVAAPLPGRRIYFLAVNHQRADLGNPHLRRALSLAIDREDLLNRFFREKPGNGVHRALDGPYPPGSWACNPKVKPADLFDVGRARAQMDEFKKKNVRLSLKYPNDDPALDAAMKYLATNLKNTIGVDVDAMPMPPRRLREAVEEEQDYELAYCYYDYPDQTYWLWPLLDPRSAQLGGRNYLGYTKAANLERRFQEVRGHRNFDRVREITHTIHRIFIQQEMPFIPLWQLDRQLVVHNDLLLYDGVRNLPVHAGTPLPLDPLRLFSTVEYWKVRRKQ